MLGNYIAPMPHAFVDESKRGPYLMCAFVTEPAARKAVTAELQRLRKSGASRIHMKNETASLKRSILAAAERPR